MLKNFKIVYFFISAIIISILLSNIVLGSFLQPLDQTLQKETATNTEKQQMYAYRVSVFNGKLAVFDGDSKIPYKVYDTYVSTLPQEDISILEQGIKVNTAAELMKIIEEYTS